MPEDFYGRPRDIPAALEWQAGVIEAALRRRDGAVTEADRLEATDALLGCVRELPAWLRQAAEWAREQEKPMTTTQEEAMRRAVRGLLALLGNRMDQPEGFVSLAEFDAAFPPSPSPYGFGAVAGRHPGTPGEGPKARGRPGTG